MNPPLLVEHTHQPVYRVVRKSWADPLDAHYSQTRADRRWNTPEFPALYCCSSEWVARAVALDVFRLAGVVPDDLQPAYQPELAEISWSGWAADVAFAEGVAAAGFPPQYPRGVSKEQTRGFATSCHGEGIEGIVCRSASLARMGLSTWDGPHQRWGEVAIFTRNAVLPLVLAGRRETPEWFPRPSAGGE